VANSSGARGDGTSVSGSGSSHSPLTSRPQPIIVQFANRKTRNTTLALRRQLKGKGFSISEQLTSRRAALLKKSTELVQAGKLESAWSHDGRVLIKSLNHRTVVINNSHDLASFQ